MNRTRIPILQLALLAATAMLAGCAGNVMHEEVMASYANGNPKTVFLVQQNRNGQNIRVGETGYYEEGQLQYEMHFAGEQPTGEWTFYYEDGTLFASGDYSNDHEFGEGWQFFNAKGEPLYEGSYDSLKVLEYTAEHRPLSVAYYSGNEEMRYQFNENYTLNAKGKVVNGMKEGLWEFYYANGQKLLEARYLNDVENGTYNSYRENGIPYFRGFYINGKRANVWEVYDEAGNLIQRKDYDK